MMWSAAFFSLFWQRKLRRLSRQEDPSDTRGARGALFLIQVWFNACSAVLLSRGFCFNRSPIKSGASAEMPPQSALSNLTSPARILPNISFSVFPENGGRPTRRMYIMTPQLHRSHRLQYAPESTSGAI